MKMDDNDIISITHQEMHPTIGKELKHYDVRCEENNEQQGIDISWHRVTYCNNLLETPFINVKHLHLQKASPYQCFFFLAHLDRMYTVKPPLTKQQTFLQNSVPRKPPPVDPTYSEVHCVLVTCLFCVFVIRAPGIPACHASSTVCMFMLALEWACLCHSHHVGKSSQYILI